jgi:hypothetical protein
MERVFMPFELPECPRAPQSGGCNTIGPVMPTILPTREMAHAEMCAYGNCREITLPATMDHLDCAASYSNS